VFNLSGSELVFLVIIALVVLGPDKLPEAMRKAGKAYADFKKMTSGFQNEMKSVLDEPMRELRETAELAKKSAMFDMNIADTKPNSASMAAQTPKPTPPVTTPPEAAAVPVVAAVEPAAPVEAPVVAGTEESKAAPVVNDATSRRLARQQGPQINVSTAPLPIAPPAAPAPDAVVASGTMAGFGIVAAAESSTAVAPDADDTDGAHAE
jgi:sec-independent protein translocase protein TatB